jgi:aminopeptidase YwaD
MYALEKEDFPFPFSGPAKDIDLKTIKNSIAIIDLAPVLKENENNPHFDLKDKVYALAKEAQTQKKQVVIFKNTSKIKDGLTFDEKDKSEKLQIPVIYLTNKIAEQLGDLNYSTTLGVMIKEKKRTGHNVIAYINNNATNTIILGAHYDHLGYGEDHNSLYTGAAPMIHNGADDNASGTAALIEMSKWLKKSSYKKYNYLFVSFSGEELGLFGSKYFTDNAGLDLKTVNYMINMDMVGRLNDSTHGLTIGGYGTSPTWGQIIKKENAYFKLNLDSSGSGPSDHTSFYKKDIPVLFFFTGSHKDYHKPSDDADKINYAGELQIIKYMQNIIAQTDKMGKLAFTKTREVSMGKSSFKVSLGVMPDYTFSGSGVLVDGVSENRPAQKAGIKVGDVLIQLGEHKFTDVQSYMGALNKFNKGETTNVKLKRGSEELNFQITF